MKQLFRVQRPLKNRWIPHQRKIRVRDISPLLLPLFNLQCGNRRMDDHLRRRSVSFPLPPPPSLSHSFLIQGIYSCDQCEKVFGKQSSLARHKYEHSGEYPPSPLLPSLPLPIQYSSHLILIVFVSIGSSLSHSHRGEAISGLCPSFFLSFFLPFISSSNPYIINRLHLKDIERRERG